MLETGGGTNRWETICEPASVRFPTTQWCVLFFSSWAKTACPLLGLISQETRSSRSVVLKRKQTGTFFSTNCRGISNRSVKFIKWNNTNFEKSSPQTVKSNSIEQKVTRNGRIRPKPEGVLYDNYFYCLCLAEKSPGGTRWTAGWEGGLRSTLSRAGHAGGCSVSLVLPLTTFTALSGSHLIRQTHTQLHTRIHSSGTV